MRDERIGSILDNVMMLRDEWDQYATGIEITHGDCPESKAFRRCIRDLSDIEHDLKECYRNED